MPTGAGKSVCYQIPALLLPGLTIVISPLLSLMKDQVSALKQAGVPAAFLNSTLTPSQQREVLRRAENGMYKILYIAPERLASGDFLRFAASMEIPLVAVDEAHCVSQWGQDFRPSYLKITEFLHSLPVRPMVGAFTATATAEVKTDIKKLLELQTPLEITTGFDRPNLWFDVVQTKRKEAWLLDFLARSPGQSGIVYCATRKTVEKVCETLQGAGVSAVRYHAGLEDEERHRNQEDFVYDRVQVMAATNAFGMGIDKSNVSFVIHYNMPKNIESYYQEAGRAGRDGSPARCVLLFSPGDVVTAKRLMQTDVENDSLSEEDREAVRKLDLWRLDQMTAYCKTTGCFRARLLGYFGEEAPDRCGNCGNCNAEMVEMDITVQAQKILSAVVRVERKYRSSLGVTLIVRMLLGSRDQRVLQTGLDKLPTYGILRDTDRTQIREYIDLLIQEGYLYLTEGEYPVLRTTQLAGEVLFHGKKVSFFSRKQTEPEEIQKKPRPARAVRTAECPLSGEDAELYGALRALRTRLAQEANVPAYVVFSNAALTDMVRKWPHNLAEFLQVSGVGQAKAAQYGQVFLEEIRKWEQARKKREGFPS